MRRLALALALCACACVAMAVPAAAAPMDPGRAVAPTTTAQIYTSVLPATATDRTFVLPASPSAVGDRPADGTHSSHLGVDLGRNISFNLATIGARTLLTPAVAISP